MTDIELRKFLLEVIELPFDGGDGLYDGEAIEALKAKARQFLIGGAELKKVEP